MGFFKDTELMLPSLSPDFDAALNALAFPVQPFIDGAYRPSSARETFEPVHPADGRRLPAVAACGAQDVDGAVQVARRAFADGRWRSLGPLRRQAILSRFADLVRENTETLALFDTLEMGKPLADARFDVSIAEGLIRFFAGAVDKTEGAVVSSDPRTLAFWRDEPHGVVAAITPWNFPVVNAALKIAPALAAGNSIVLKPSEIASYSTLKLAEIAVEAGVPEGVLNVVTGFGAEAGAALGGHPDVDLMSFTGSTATGRALMTLAAQSNGKPLLLECGGKSPALVFEDMAADIERIAATIAQAGLWNAGQLCVARTRILVADEIVKPFTEALAAKVDAMRLVAPFSGAAGLGPLASASQKRRVDGHIQSALHDGARQVTAEQAAPSAEGSYVAPVVFDGVTQDMRIVQEEVFGPVLTIQSFATADEAFALANDTVYGLAATVYTRDLTIAMEAARTIQAGKVVVMGDDAAGEGSGFALGSAPWKQSGFGVESGMAGIASYSRRKAIEIRA
jgi:acyl-CoA reductase-like NAD-dependent aldehyde dehydrogenase